MTLQPRTPVRPLSPSRSAAVPAPAAPARPARGAVLRDDFVVFCDGVRRLCGIDLRPVQAGADGAARADLRPARRG